MSRAALGELRRHHPLDLGEAAEIHSVAESGAITRARPELLPGEAEASLPAQEAPRDPALAIAARVLGARLSSDSAAWRGDPVPLMRSLQKMLVGHSLTLPEDRRAPALGAIRAVELAVRWRLRWQQMRRSDAESQIIQPPRDDHATPNHA